MAPVCENCVPAPDEAVGACCIGDTQTPSSCSHSHQKPASTGVDSPAPSSRPANGSNAFVERERSVAIDNNLAIVWDVSKTTPATRPWRDYANDATDHDPLLRDLVYAQAIASAVGRAVYLHRTQRGLSQAALGRLINMPQPQVARIETGDHTPTAATLLRLCDALRLNLELSIWPRTAKRRTAPHVPHGAIVETTDQLVITIRDAD